MLQKMPPCYIRCLCISSGQSISIKIPSISVWHPCDGNLFVEVVPLFFKYWNTWAEESRYDKAQVRKVNFTTHIMTIPKCWNNYLIKQLSKVIRTIIRSFSLKNVYNDFSNIYLWLVEYYAHWIYLSFAVFNKGRRILKMFCFQIFLCK